jgi:thioredoxin 1
MLPLILFVLGGVGIGSAMGYFGQCSSGTCPLTATWWRGALYGGFMGLMFGLASGCNRPGGSTPENARVKPVNQADFTNQVLQAAQPVVVDFFATWCGPCKELAPVLEELAGDFTNQVKFVKVDVDQAPELSQQYNISGLPTLLLFKGGQVVDTITGLESRERYKEIFTRLAQGTPAAK